MSRRKPSTNEAAASPQVELGGYLGLLPIDVLTGIILNASSLTWVSLRGTCKALRQLVDEHVTTLSLRLPGLPRAGHQPGLEQSLHVPEWWKQPVNSNALDSVWEDGDEQCQVSAKALAQHLAGCSALHPKKLVIYGDLGTSDQESEFLLRSKYAYTTFTNPEGSTSVIVPSGTAGSEPGRAYQDVVPCDTSEFARLALGSPSVQPMMSHITHVEVVRSGFTSGLVQALADNAPGLTRLDLCCAVGDSTVWKELSALTALRELHCYGPDLQFRPDGVAALPGLTCLTFDTEVRDMKAEDLSALTQLSELEVHCYERVRDTLQVGLRQIQTFTPRPWRNLLPLNSLVNLRALRLDAYLYWRSPPSDCAQLAAVLQSLTALTSLTMRCAPSSDVAHAIEQLPHLVDLCLWEQGSQGLSLSFPHVTQLSLGGPVTVSALGRITAPALITLQGAELNQGSKQYIWTEHLRGRPVSAGQETHKRDTAVNPAQQEQGTSPNAPRQLQPPPLQLSFNPKLPSQPLPAVAKQLLLLCSSISINFRDMMGGGREAAALQVLREGWQQAQHEGQGEANRTSTRGATTRTEGGTASSSGSETVHPPPSTSISPPSQAADTGPETFRRGAQPRHLECRVLHASSSVMRAIPPFVTHLYLRFCALSRKLGPEGEGSLTTLRLTLPHLVHLTLDDTGPIYESDLQDLLVYAGMGSGLKIKIIPVSADNRPATSPSSAREVPARSRISAVAASRPMHPAELGARSPSPQETRRVVETQAAAEKLMASAADVHRVFRQLSRIGEDHERLRRWSVGIPVVTVEDR